MRVREGSFWKIAGGVRFEEEGKEKQELVKGLPQRNGVVRGLSDWSE
jgi:hypothetical protein